MEVFKINATEKIISDTIENGNERVTVRSILSAAVKFYGKDEAFKMGKEFLKVKKWDAPTLRKLIDTYQVSFDIVEWPTGYQILINNQTV